MLRGRVFRLEMPEQVRLILEERMVSRAFALFVVALPLACLLLAAAVWYRRRG